MELSPSFVVIRRLLLQQCCQVNGAMSHAACSGDGGEPCRQGGDEHLQQHLPNTLLLLHSLR